MPAVVDRRKGWLEGTVGEEKGRLVRIIAFWTWRMDLLV